ncbi:radical SAM protein [Thermodesulfobacteriota bacterium]
MESDPLIKIAELFYSIQGESSFAGYPCFFIRFADCNLRCTYCDTRYAYEENHPQFSISQILIELKKYPGAIVEITGGEPLLQEGIYPLLEKLLAAGRTVLLETNGSLSLADVPEDVVKIMDMKCPGSGMHEQMDFDNFDLLDPKDEIKFVIGSRDDYNWAVQVVSAYGLQNKTTVTFSPVSANLLPATLAGWILDDHLPVRLRLQLHTIIWPGKIKGY